ncbi:PAS domain-containing protein [Methylobacterium komagatae]
MNDTSVPPTTSLSHDHLEDEVRRLRAQSASLAQMFEQGPSFIALLSGPEHRFTLTNAAYRSVVAGRDLIGQTVAEALPEAAAQGYVDLLDEVFRTGQVHRGTRSKFEVRVDPEGPLRERYLDFVYQPIFDAGGTVSGIFVEGYDVTEQTLTEASLREHEARYRTLFESIDVGFCIVAMKFEGPRAVDYRILEANPAFVRQTGANVVGQWVSELAPDLERLWFDTYGHVALTGEPAHFEHYAEVFGRWFEVHALRTGDPAAHRVAIFFSDITERRLIEQRAEAGERDLRLITDALPVLIAFIGEDGIYRFANRAYEDWFFKPAQDIIGRNVQDLLSRESYALRKPYIERALAGETVTFELDWPHRDGRPRIAEIRYLPRRTDGRVDGYHVFVQDVTGRKETEADLAGQVAARTAERDQIWQSSPDLMLVIDSDGVFRRVNPAWTRLLGYSEAELVGHHVNEFVLPDDHAETVEAYIEAAAGGQPRIVNRYRHKDGQIRWISWVATPVGTMTYATGRDITMEREQADILRQTEEALRQSQKMEAVGQLTGGVAHDFNNMLTIIRSSVDFLRRPDLPEDRRTRYMDAVSETVDRAAKLTGQLLAFARRQALKPEVLNVGERLQGLAEMLNTVTGSRVRVTTDTPDAPCYVRVDVSQFETALVNLAVNARDAMDGEGALTLSLVCGSPMPPIRAHSGSPGPYAKILMNDTGCGIPKTDLVRVFEPFFTTKEIGKGTGLGLSQVFGFAKQSGGDIEVASEVGRGTTFTLYLPEVEAEDGDDSEDEDIGPAPHGSGQRVLVVEDNLEVGRFATQILEDLGYQTEWVTNAEAALKRLGRDGNGFEAVFSDVVMPGMGGIGLAQELRQRLPLMPVVLASGYSHVLAENDAHGFELLHKPYSADQLSRILRRVTRRGRRNKRGDRIRGRS